MTKEAAAFKDAEAVNQVLRAMLRFAEQRSKLTYSETWTVEIRNLSISGLVIAEIIKL